MMPLGLLSPGEKARVVCIEKTHSCRAGGSICRGRLEDLGLRVGKIIEMLGNGGKGPILVRVDGSRIALGRGVPMKIKVRRRDR
jgi:ferrous iron transport protein A